MRPIRLALPFAAFLLLAACNPAGNSAQHDFNAAGPALGSGNVGGGAADIGHGFSNGANATGQAITSTAKKVGNSL